MENEDEGKEKNKWMYTEVRFQRNSSRSLKKQAAAFRLKCNQKNLETSSILPILVCNLISQEVYQILLLEI